MSQERPMEDVRNTIGEYARMLRHRWRPALAGLTLVASAAFWCSQLLPRRYAASTIFERRDDVVLRNLINNNSPYSFDNLRSTLTMDMTGSRAMAEAAVALDLLAPDAVPAEGALTDAGLRALDETLAAHGLRATVQMLQSTPSLDTIKLTCEARDPDLAQRCVTCLRDRYLSRTSDRITQVLLSARQFFRGEVDRFQQQLAETDQALTEPFKNFPGLDPTDKAAAGNRLELLRNERERLLERKTELEAQVAAREQFLAEEAAPATRPIVQTGPSAPEQQVRRSLNDALAKTDQEIADNMSLRRMTAEHPAIRALQAKREALFATLEALGKQSNPQTDAESSPESRTADVATAADPGSSRLQRVQMELHGLERQLTAAQANFERADERVRRFAALFERLLKDGQGLRELTDQAAAQAATIATWREHLLQLDRILAAENEQRGTVFTVLEEPKNTGRPVAPRIGSVLAVCTGSGLAAAALLVAILELLDRSFRTSGQVARVLGIPVLECIGVISTPQVRRKRWLSRLLWTPALALLVALFLTTGALAYASLECRRAHQSALLRLSSALPRYLSPPGTSGAFLDAKQ
jgi:uncharacterized protein involved in exopolysaccharide biosynthesis